MEPWGVLVWNMARGAKKRGKAADTWAYLARLIEDHDVQVALLNEADVYSLRAANTAATRDGQPEPALFSEQGTMGRDFWDKDGVRTRMTGRGGPLRRYHGRGRDSLAKTMSER